MIRTHSARVRSPTWPPPNSIMRSWAKELRERLDVITGKDAASSRPLISHRAPAGPRTGGSVRSLPIVGESDSQQRQRGRRPSAGCHRQPRRSRVSAPGNSNAVSRAVRRASFQPVVCGSSSPVGLLSAVAGHPGQRRRVAVPLSRLRVCSLSASCGRPASFFCTVPTTQFFCRSSQETG